MLQEVVFQCMPLFLVGLYYHSIQRWRHLASTVCYIIYLPNGLQTPNNYSHIFINNTHHTKSTFLLHMWHLISPRPGLAFMSLGTIVLNVGEPPRSYHYTAYIIMPPTTQLFYLAESVISFYMLQYCTHIYSKMIHISLRTPVTKCSLQILSWPRGEKCSLLRAWIYFLRREGASGNLWKVMGILLRCLLVQPTATQLVGMISGKVLETNTSRPGPGRVGKARPLYCFAYRKSTCT